MNQIETEFTKLLNCRYPLIGAPMFLVSNTNIVSEVTNAGGVGVFPTLNCRSEEVLESWLSEIESRVGDKPYGVNIVVNRANDRYKADLDLVLKHNISLIVSSLGDPTELIKKAHESNVKVICDVINIKHAKKALDAGADGLIVVSSGAGGHAGPLSPYASIPWFKKHFPEALIVSAGGIASGQSMAASLALGADAVSVGTRFIASQESEVEEEYKKAIVNASPEDIFMSKALSGVNASIMKTKHNKDFYEWNNSLRGKISQFVTFQLLKKGLKLKKKYSWKNVWSAGQSVADIDKVSTCKEIVNEFVSEYQDSFHTLEKTLK